MAKQNANVDTQTRSEEVVSPQGGLLRGGVRTLGIIGIILLVAVGGVFYYNYSKAKSNDRALIELGRIRPYYDRGEFDTAINGDSIKKINGEKIRGLRAIADEWKSTPAGKISALLLGQSYLALGQTDKASEPFELATGADAEVVRSAAHAGLAAVAESKNKFDEAAKEYVKAASEDHLEYNAPHYLLGAARNYERAGNKDEAIKHYRTVATKYTQATEANTQARLALSRNNVEL